jgi:hypothetical protein
LKTSKVLRAARDEKQIFALGSSGVAEPGGKVCLDGKLAIFPADKGKGIAHHEACILTLSVNTALLMTLSRRILTIMQAGYSVSSGRVRQSDFFQYRISHL